MNLNKYTEKAQEAVVAAQKLAEELSHAQIEPEHLLVTLAEQPDGVAPAVLRGLKVDPAGLAQSLRDALNRGSRVSGGAQVALSARLRSVTDGAEAEASRLKDEVVSTEHLLLAIAAEAPRVSPGSRLLQERGVTKDRLLEALAGG